MTIQCKDIKIGMKIFVSSWDSSSKCWSGGVPCEVTHIRKCGIYNRIQMRNDTGMIVSKDIQRIDHVTVSQ